MNPVLLDPTGETAPAQRQPLSKPASLAGLTLGLLDISKARSQLGWHPVLGLDEALAWIVNWHQHLRAGGDARAISLDQIRSYSQRAGMR